MPVTPMRHAGAHMSTGTPRGLLCLLALFGGLVNMPGLALFPLQRRGRYVRLEQPQRLHDLRGGAADASARRGSRRRATFVAAERFLTRLAVARYPLLALQLVGVERRSHGGCEAEA